MLILPAEQLQMEYLAHPTTSLQQHELLDHPDIRKETKYM